MYPAWHNTWHGTHLTWRDTTNFPAIDFPRNFCFDNVAFGFEEDGNDSIMPKVDLKQDAEKCPEVVCSLCSCDTNKEKQKIKYAKSFLPNSSTLLSITSDANDSR